MSNDYESPGSQLKRRNAALNSSAGHRDQLTRPSETTQIIDLECISQSLVTAPTALLKDELRWC